MKPSRRHSRRIGLAGLLVVCGMGFALAAGCGSDEPAPSPSPEAPSPTPEPTPTATQTEMVVDSVRVSLMNSQRVVILRVKGSDLFLPIWIGPFEAEAIALKLRDISLPRPMTHDLLGSVIADLGATVDRVVVTDLRDNTFYARVFLRHNGTTTEVDSRPSDAIALAGRTGAPIFAEDSVLEKASLAGSSEPEFAVMDEDDLGPIN